MSKVTAFPARRTNNGRVAKRNAPAVEQNAMRFSGPDKRHGGQVMCHVLLRLIEVVLELENPIVVIVKG